ncbi:MAG: hypothetical protein ACI4GZ_00650, partial [Ruminococcus sp.]
MTEHNNQSYDVTTPPYVDSQAVCKQSYSAYAGDMPSQPDAAPSFEAVPSEQKKKKGGYWSFTKVQKAFAFVALFLGYLVNEFVLTFDSTGLGGLIFFEAAVLCVLIFALCEGAKLKAGNVI